MFAWRVTTLQSTVTLRQWKFCEHTLFSYVRLKCFVLRWTMSEQTNFSFSSLSEHSLSFLYKCSLTHWRLWEILFSISKFCTKPFLSSHCWKARKLTLPKGYIFTRLNSVSAPWSRRKKKIMEKYLRKEWLTASANFKKAQSPKNCWWWLHS